MFDCTPESVDEILEANDVTVRWSSTVINGRGEKRTDIELASWGLSWSRGGISLESVPEDDEDQARLAAAMFIYLWLKKVDVGHADKLAQCFAAQYKIRRSGQVICYDFRHHHHDFRGE